MVLLSLVCIPLKLELHKSGLCLQSKRGLSLQPEIIPGNMAPRSQQGMPSEDLCPKSGHEVPKQDVKAEWF